MIAFLIFHYKILYIIIKFVFQPLRDPITMLKFSQILHFTIKYHKKYSPFSYFQ
jgi:hypothetical protein